MKTSSVRTPSRLLVSWTAGAAIAATTALVLGGCTSPAPVPTATETTSAAAVETPTPTPTPSVFAPLTGEPVDAPITNPSIASKIDNLIDARPQIGLQYTDMVYEELVEGGLTRYIAVWQSDIPKVYGPVRSIRGMDPSIVSPLGGLMTYSGGQPIFVAGIKNTDVVNVSDDQYGGDSSLFYRTGAKVAPHNLLAKGQNVLAKFGDGVAAPKQQFDFAASAAESSAGTTGKPTTKLTAVFSEGQVRTWTWVDAKQVWARSQNGVVDKDDDGNRLTAVNVVTIRVKLKTISHTPVSQLNGTNAATISTDGKTIEGTYTKDSDTDPIHLFDADGKPITLAPGNTWIELVATGGSVSTE